MQRLSVTAALAGNGDVGTAPSGGGLEDRVLQKDCQNAVVCSVKFHLLLLFKGPGGGAVQEDRFCYCTDNL